MNSEERQQAEDELRLLDGILVGLRRPAEVFSVVQASTDRAEAVKRLHNLSEPGHGFYNQAVETSTLPTGASAAKKGKFWMERYMGSIGYHQGKLAQLIKLGLLRSRPRLISAGRSEAQLTLLFHETNRSRGRGSRRPRASSAGPRQQPGSIWIG